MRVVLLSLVIRDASKTCLLLFYLRVWLLNIEMWVLTLVLLLLFLGWVLLLFSIFIVVIVLVLVISLLVLSFGRLLGLGITFNFLFFLGCPFALLLALLFLLLFCLFLKKGKQRVRRAVLQFLMTLVAICSLVGPSQPRLPCFPYLSIFF